MGRRGSLQLFPISETPLPAAVAGETLFSWCARYHRLSGQVDPRKTSSVLFGHQTIGLRHDLPGRLDHFQSVTGRHLGEVDGLVSERTLFGMHAPFLEEGQRRAVIDAMRGGDRVGVRKLLGLNARALSCLTPLKACFECISEDRFSVPSAWWHIEHQWPTVFVCPRHRQNLGVAPTAIAAGGLSDWCLPTDFRAPEWKTMPPVSLPEQLRLAGITDWTVSLMKRPHLRLDPVVLRYVYLLRAKSLGWITTDGSLRLAHLREVFYKAHCGLGAWPGWSFIDEAAAATNGGFLGFILRHRTPYKSHAAKHVLLMAFLFDEPDQFFEKYALAEATAAAEGEQALHAQLTDVRARLVKMVAGEGRSVNSACNELAIPVSQAIPYLQSEGIEYRRCPRVLTPEKRKALEALLTEGAERAAIAAQLGLRPSLIKNYLATNPALRTTWKKARWEGRTRQYRSRLLQLLEENPGVTTRALCKVDPETFGWLRRNDREWLATHLPLFASLPATTIGPRSRA